MPQENLIGEYLRARRDSLSSPQTSGSHSWLAAGASPASVARQVAPLRCVSADYYVRLKQGRDQHPSTQVLDALGRALRLDDDAIAHLHSLAARVTRPRRRPSARQERVPAGILELISTWHETPRTRTVAYIGRYPARPIISRSHRSAP